jgi:hypothetical protein
MVQFVSRRCEVCGALYFVSSAAARVDDGLCVKCDVPVFAAQAILSGETHV